MPQLPDVEDLGPAEDEGDRTREQVLQHLGAGKEEASRGGKAGGQEAPRGAEQEN